MARKKLSKREIEKRREAKRERAKKAAELVANRVAELVGPSAGWQGWVDVLQQTARCYKYSFSNTLLIDSEMLERGLSGRVAGYRAWQAEGRQVRRGEAGIQIFAPAGRLKQKQQEGDGKKENDEDEGIMLFKTTTVFAESQTDPLEACETEDSEAPDVMECTKQLLAFANRLGFPVSFKKLDGAAGTCCFRPVQEILITTGLKPLMTASVLVHEIAHALLHSAEDYLKIHADVTQAEVEAESVAYCVLSALGFDPPVSAFRYIAHFSEGNPDAVKASMKVIQQTTKQIIQGLENSDEAKQAAA